MTTIENLHKSISSMTQDELIQFIKERRALRRELPPKPTRKSRVKAKSKKKPVIKSVDAAINHMQGKEEELLKLLLARRKNDSKTV